MSDADVPILPSRPADGHKGTFGTVLVVGGCETPTRMIGAPALAARAALRAGCGLARLAMPASVLDTALSTLPSATGLPIANDKRQAMLAMHAAMREASVTLIGPGLGPHSDALVASVLNKRPHRVVVDADALNALARLGVEPLGRMSILTPHPGEFRRLATSAGIEYSPTASEERPMAAQALAIVTDSVVVLKGSETVVADADQIWTSHSADSSLATGGTGDVLAGLIAGLWASTSLETFEVARTAVWAHARAAELWREHRHASAGLLAHELADLLPRALEERRS